MFQLFIVTLQDNIHNIAMKENKSPYYRGAKAGRFFGLYLSAIFLAMALSSKLPLLSAATLVLTLCIPVAVYRPLRRSYIESKGEASFSELWVQGIAMFLFGSAICGLVTLVYMKWIAPGFLVRQVLDAIESCNAIGTPEYMECARILKNMISQGVVPSPSTFVISMFWLTMAGGCILSLIMALIARLSKPDRRSDKPSRAF